MNKRGFGYVGECSAALYLEKEGYTVIGRNVYVGKCEIDIIARNDTHVVFVEVKTRRQRPGVRDFYGRPAKAVNSAKRQSMLEAAGRYLREHPELLESLSPRLDVIEVYADPDREEYRILEIKHFPGAVHK